MSALRALFFADPLIILATIVMGSVSLLTSLFDASGNAQHKVARAWARLLIAFGGLRVRVEGLEKIEPGRAYVFASNHLSLMDTPVVIAHIPAQFRFLAKKGLFKVPFIGYHLKRAGHIPVQRGEARASLRAMSDTARRIRECGVSVLVFPEGGRSPGEMRPFKEGAAYIAIKAGVPVVPVGLAGTRGSLPMGSVLVRPADVIVQIGDPIPTANLITRDHGRLTEQLRAQVAELARPMAAERVR